MMPRLGVCNVPANSKRNHSLLQLFRTDKIVVLTDKHKPCASWLMSHGLKRDVTCQSLHLDQWCEETPHQSQTVSDFTLVHRAAEESQRKTKQKSSNSRSYGYLNQFCWAKIKVCGKTKMALLSDKVLCLLCLINLWIKNTGPEGGIEVGVSQMWVGLLQKRKKPHCDEVVDRAWDYRWKSLDEEG